MRDLEELVKAFKVIDDAILNWSRHSRKRVLRLSHRLNHIHRDALRLKLSFQDDSLYQSGHHETTVKKVENLLENIATAKDFLVTAQREQQSTSLRLLTQISTVCLPLGILVGFFGMNFEFMGIDPGTRGILRMKHSQAVFWALFIGLITAIFILFYLDIF